MAAGSGSAAAGSGSGSGSDVSDSDVFDCGSHTAHPEIPQLSGPYAGQHH
eukprot:SAG11_NODE_39423_length_232_cov_24.383459_1_plen_49_part_10